MTNDPRLGVSNAALGSRRRFLTDGASALVGMGFLRKDLFAGMANRRNGARPVMHIIGHSHIDAAWLWPWSDSADLVLTTFRSALDRMNETLGFRYSHSSMVHYRWVQEADPIMFEEICEHIREGRWEVVGGWPVEPDCNIPSTESFARHCLYGKQYAKHALGVGVDIGFNPDSFGHAAGLPTILKHAGYKYYVFMRPQELEMNLPRLFWWEGPDGSRVMALRIYGSYDWGAEHLREAADRAFPSGFDDAAFFLGVGDHGGAVTKAQIKEVLSMQNDESLPELRWSTLHEFFGSIESSPSMKYLPIIQGDLQHHSRGCYSACGEEKLENRRAEHQLFTAESVAFCASLSCNRSYHLTSHFADAWDRVLFNQFHDVLAGTALFSDYENARDGIGYACDIAMRTRHSGLEAMARQVDLQEVPEGAIFAYNPVPWRRKALLEFHYQIDEKANHRMHLKARDGSTIPLQTRPSDSMTKAYPRLSTWVDLPPCGYKVFGIERDGPLAAQDPFPQFASISERAFGLNSIHADDGTELLSASLGLVVIEDKSDTWAHDVASFRTEIGRPRFISAEIIEDGPVTRVTRQKLQWQDSHITLDIAVFTMTDAIELRFVIDWHEHEQILKLEIPTKLLSPRVFAKVPGAALQRAPNGNEEPYQDWIALQGLVGSKSYTIALINNGTYSYDCLDGLLRTILIRSAPYARHNPNLVEADGINAWQDQGRQERTFWLVRGQGDFTNLSLDRMAQELQLPAEYVLDSHHDGANPWEQSFLEVAPDNIEVLAIKQSENGADMIIRMQERAGKQTKTQIRSQKMDLDMEIMLSPWEIKTLSIARNTVPKPQSKIVSILEN
jgi:alpha-mannosidase